MLSIFLKFSQNEKRGFIWPKTFGFLPQKRLLFYSEKRDVSWKWLFLNSKNVKRYNIQFGQKSLQIPVKGPIFSEVTDLQPENLLKHELFQGYF